MDADDAEHNRPSEEALNKEEEEDDATVGAAAATETKSAASFQHPGAVLDEEEEKEEEEAGGSGGIEDKDPWELVREIEPDEETVECGTDECSDAAVATWTTSTDPNFRIHLCTNCENEQIGEYDAGAGKEVNELWDVVRVIPTEEEKVQCCCVHGCINPAVATWSSNIDPEEMLDLCEDCQVEEMGGWPDGENKRRKYEIVVEADRTTAKLSNEYNFEDNDNDNDNDDAEDKDKVDDEDEVATHYQQAVPQHQFLPLLAQQLSPSTNGNTTSLTPPPIRKLPEYLTMEAKDDIIVEIIRRRKTGEKWDSIAVAMGRKEACLKTLTYSSAHHKSEYMTKIVEKEQTENQSDFFKKKATKHRVNNPPEAIEEMERLGFSVPKTENESNFFQMPFTQHEANVLLERAMNVTVNRNFVLGYRNQARIYNKDDKLVMLANSWLNPSGLEVRKRGDGCWGIVNWHPAIDKLKLNEGQNSCKGFKEGSRGRHNGEILGHTLHYDGLKNKDHMGTFSLSHIEQDNDTCAKYYYCTEVDGIVVRHTKIDGTRWQGVIGRRWSNSLNKHGVEVVGNNGSFRTAVRLALSHLLVDKCYLFSPLFW